VSDRICLIVDDEISIRAYLRAIMERARFQSLEADTVGQALRILQKIGGRLDVVISDINMPGDMNGVDLAHSVRNSFPDIPVILISGYADEDSVKKVAPDFEFIQKPFVPDTILKAVEKAIAPRKPL